MGLNLLTSFCSSEFVFPEAFSTIELTLIGFLTFLNAAHAFLAIESRWRRLFISFRVLSHVVFSNWIAACFAAHQSVLAMLRIMTFASDELVSK